VERAIVQHGYLVTGDARELGINPDYLRRLTALGKLEHRWRGVYRLVAMPVADTDEYYEAVLWAGSGGAVVGESALALWGLADVHPRQVEVAVVGGRPVQRSKPNGRVLVMTYPVDPDTLDEVDHIPVVRPQTAIAQAVAGGTDPEHVRQAISAARGKGLLGEVAAARLLVALVDQERTGQLVAV